MLLDDPDEISAGGHDVHVPGRPLRGEPVRVTIDGETTELPPDGDTETARKPHELLATHSNGAQVTDKPHKQLLELPDGVSVVRKPHKTLVTLADGTEIVDKPHETLVEGGSGAR